jgi:hypothetical protein
LGQYARLKPKKEPWEFPGKPTYVVSREDAGACVLLSVMVLLQDPLLLAEFWTKASWFPLEEWENNA